MSGHLPEDQAREYWDETRSAASGCECNLATNTHVDGNMGHNPFCPEHPRNKFLVIGDQCSWEAVIAPDGGTVPREAAESELARHGCPMPPEGPEETRFREVAVTPGAEWDREFVRDHTGPIHGWVIEQ